METNEVIRKAVGAIIFVVGGLIGGSSQVRSEERRVGKECRSRG